MQQSLGRIGILLLLLSFGLALPSSAQYPFRPRVGTTTTQLSGREIAAITVNDTVAITLRASVGGLTPTVRAQAIAARLTQIIANGLQPGQVAAKPSAAQTWQVAAGPTQILTATHADEVSQGTTSADLCRTWANNLRTLLTQPPLTASSKALIVPIGETRTLAIGGAARPSDVTANDSNHSVTLTRYDPGTRTLTLIGTSLGRNTVTLQTQRDGIANYPIEVRVESYAAQVLPEITINITGSPAAPPEIVEQAAYIGLSQAVNAQPQAEVRMFTPPKITTPLKVGTQTDIKMPIRLAGEDLIPVNATPVVHITNEDVAARPATALLYSNNPEQVKTPQVLFVGGIRPFQPARLIFHHQNISGTTLVFHADIVNSGSAPAPVQLISGVASPGTDTVQVGRRAGAVFLHMVENNIGVIVTVPPHGRLPLLSQRFADGSTVSGIVQVAQTDGQAGTVTLQVGVDRDADTLSSLSRLIQNEIGSNAVAAVPSLNALDTDATQVLPAAMLSPYIFGTPQITTAVTYSVGSQWAHLRIGGRDALRDLSGQRFLFGNYGVDYAFTVTLNNPSTRTQNIAFLFEPEAGTAAGIFQIDSDPIFEIDPHDPPDELLIDRITLAAGETRVVQMRTIPLNGSAYPASIVIHAL